MFSTCHDQKVPTKDFCPSVSQSLRHITETKNPCVLVLTRCHVTDINHVLTPCHVIEINYVDRGVAARTPLQYKLWSRRLDSRPDESTETPLGS